MRKSGGVRLRDGSRDQRDRVQPESRVNLAPVILNFSQATLILRELRADILKGVLLPGERLRMDPLRQKYRIGLSPLREAMMRLTAEGLIILEDQRGFRVAPVSREELLDLTDTRVDIESKAARLAVERGGDAWEAQVLSAHHRLHLLESRPPSGADDEDEWSERHAAFHRSLIVACNSVWLLRFRDTLFDQTERYRRLVRHRMPERICDDEHKQMADAAVRRDAAALSRLLTSHIRRTTQDVLSCIALIDAPGNSPLLAKPAPPSTSESQARRQR